MSSIDYRFLRRLRTLGLVEGVSTLVLFGIAMPLKYVADMPMAVRITGTVHGALFVLLAMMLLAGVRRIPLPTRVALAGIGAAIIPFGPFVFDRTLKRAAETGQRSSSGDSASDTNKGN